MRALVERARMFVGRDLSAVAVFEQRLIGDADRLGFGAIVVGLASGLLIGWGAARRMARLSA